jgi:tRNA (mo5U34)-methyltransferase
VTPGARGIVPGVDVIERASGYRWYHTLELADGYTTEGLFDLRPHVDSFGIPEDLTGKRCLDVGTWDGFWAFELERRGAAEVVALDLQDESRYDYPPRRRPESFPELHNPGFRLAKEVFQSGVELVDCNIYDARPEDLGTFDVVFCGAMVIHLRDQYLALERIANLCRGTFISGEPYHALLSLLPVPVSRYRADREKSVVFWEPNARAWRRMIWSAGFERVDERKRFRMRSSSGYRVNTVVHHGRK